MNTAKKKNQQLYPQAYNHLKSLRPSHPPTATFPFFLSLSPPSPSLPSVTPSLRWALSHFSFVTFQHGRTIALTEFALSASLSLALSLCALLSHTSSPHYHSLRSRGNHTVWTKCATNLSDDVCFPPPSPCLFFSARVFLTLSTYLTKCRDMRHARTSTEWKFAAPLLK